MQQNLETKRLSDEHFRRIDRLFEEKGPLRFLDPSRHLGFDIFDEDEDQPTGDVAPWD